VDDFANLYHESQGSTWNNTFWRGVRTQKLPLDAWIFQEIIHETRPDVIVEAGTFQGRKRVLHGLADGFDRERAGHHHRYRGLSGKAST
jgi:cephalosporin hydroxylase